jgi:predicted nucleic acid-binding protein
MIYLLDVNALLALGILEHEFHQRTAKWIKKTAAGEATFATSAITELGFLRVLLQSSYAGATVGQGQKLLALLKSSGQLPFQFLVDDQDAVQLPQWVKWPNQVTGGHLVALAKAHGAVLATLDEKTRGAFLIPCF